MTNGIIDGAPPCEKCAHYKRDDAADPINRDLCQIGPINARYQRTENCMGKWFIWRDGMITWPKAGAKR